MLYQIFRFRALLWTFAIFIIVGIPGNQIPKVSDWLDVFQPDKIVHIGLFAPLAFLWSSFFYERDYSKLKSILFSVVFGMFYAISTELLQFYVFIGRNGNIADALADIIGLFLGIVIWIKWPKKINT